MVILVTCVLPKQNGGLAVLASCTSQASASCSEINRRICKRLVLCSPQLGQNPVVIALGCTSRSQKNSSRLIIKSLPFPNPSKEHQLSGLGCLERPRWWSQAGADSQALQSCMAPARKSRKMQETALRLCSIGPGPSTEPGPSRPRPSGSQPQERITRCRSCSRPSSPSIATLETKQLDLWAVRLPISG